MVLANAHTQYNVLFKKGYTHVGKRILDPPLIPSRVVVVCMVYVGQAQVESFHRETVGRDWKIQKLRRISRRIEPSVPCQTHVHAD